MAQRPYIGVKNAPLPLCFFLGLSAFLLAPLFFPSFRLFAFAPYLAIVLKRKRLLFSLWTAVLTGLFVDLCNTDLPFGLFAFSYGSAAALSFLFRKWFTLEFSPSFCLYTAFLSSLFSLIHLTLLSFSGYPFPLHLSSFLTNFFLMPLADGAYAFCWFTSPIFLYNLLKRRKMRRSPYR